MKYLLIFLLASQSVFGQESVKMGNKIWAPTNLNTTRFLNGDLIPRAQSDEKWQEAGFNHEPAWCYYQSNEKGVETSFGVIYNIYAIADPRGLVPEGWRISTVADWDDLEQHVKNSGSQLIDLLTIQGWPFGLRSDKFNLSIFPGGWRDVGCGGMNENITYWCEPTLKSQLDNLEMKTLTVQQYDDASVQLIDGSTSWIMGHYIRLVKDVE